MIWFVYGWVSGQVLVSYSGYWDGLQHSAPYAQNCGERGGSPPLHLVATHAALYTAVIYSPAEALGEALRTMGGQCTLASRWPDSRVCLH